MQRTARTCSYERAARVARLFFHPRPIKFLIYGVVVAVPVVDAKTPYYRARRHHYRQYHCHYGDSGADQLEHATPILSLCHGIFTD